MKCLVIDTTTDVAGIAVTDGREILGENEFTHKMDLSRRLMPTILQVLKDCKLSMQDLEGIGVSVGPGSFTGLRIGVVTAKTLAQVLNLPIVGIVSLDLLAHQIGRSQNALICPLMKVHRGEVYYAFYRASEHEAKRFTEYGAGPLDEVIGHAQDLTPNEVVFCGDAVDIHAAALEQTLGNRALLVPSYPKVAVLARLAHDKLAANEGLDPLTLLPLYVRRSAPEIRFDTAHGAA